jgi:hypothetical protein
MRSVGKAQTDDNGGIGAEGGFEGDERSLDLGAGGGCEGAERDENENQKTKGTGKSGKHGRKIR